MGGSRNAYLVNSRLDLPSYTYHRTNPMTQNTRLVRQNAIWTSPVTSTSRTDGPRYTPTSWTGPAAHQNAPYDHARSNKTKNTPLRTSVLTDFLHSGDNASAERYVHGRVSKTPFSSCAWSPFTYAKIARKIVRGDELSCVSPKYWYTVTYLLGTHGNKRGVSLSVGVSRPRTLFPPPYRRTTSSSRQI